MFRFRSGIRQDFPPRKRTHQERQRCENEEGNTRPKYLLVLISIGFVEGFITVSLDIRSSTSESLDALSMSIIEDVSIATRDDAEDICFRAPPRLHSSSDSRERCVACGLPPEAFEAPELGLNGSNPIKEI